MKKITRKHGVALLAIALANFNLSAQDGGATSELNPLNVVGSKGEAPQLSSSLKSGGSLEDIPQSISVMTNAQFKAQGLNSIGDIIDYTPGVVTSQGEGHRDAAVIRGQRTTSDFYLDGVRDDVQYYRPLYNVEQVEVLRGSNALVTGFGGGYGLINRVSKKGVIGKDFTTLQGSLDTFGEINAQVDKNIDFGNKALRINIFGESLENHRDFYYGDSFGVTPTMHFDFDGATLDLSYEYLDQERFIDRGIPTGANLKPVESFKDIVFGDATKNLSTHEAHILRAILETELSDTFTGTFKLAHSKHDKLYQNVYADSYNETARPNEVRMDGYVDTTKRESTTLSADINGELQTGGILHNLLAGLEYISINNDNNRYNTDVGANTDKFSVAIAPNLGIRGNSLSGTAANTLGVVSPLTNDYTSFRADQAYADVSVLSLYLQDEISLSDSLDLILGARYNRIEFDVFDEHNTAHVVDTDSEISPRAGLIFDATENMSFYAAYSESITARNDEQYADVKGDDEKVDANTFENLEAGINVNLTNNISLNASVFQLTAVKPDWINANETIMRESEVNGFELQVYGSLIDNLYTTASYTSLDAETVLVNTIGGVVTPNTQPSQEAPENMFSIWNNYLVNDRFSINLGVIYQDSSIIDHDDGKPLYANPKAFLPDYTRVDAGAAYALTDNTRLQVRVENLFDEVYFPNAHDTHQATVGAPVNAMFTITSSF
jgi:catecholate siderophore receptor